MFQAGAGGGTAGAGMRNGTAGASQLLIPQGAAYLTGGGAVANAVGIGAAYWNPAGVARATSNLETSFSKESVLEIHGKVITRKDINSDLDTGEIEVKVDKFNVLSKASQLPFIIHDELEAKEDTRLRHRYLDLRRPKMFSNLLTRHRLVKSIRDFLDDNQFLEIETPLLSKSTPEGARDFLVPTRNEGKFFALPQSPQLYKQLLMASGVEKYFQVVRCFRDEDSRKDRQPEFTQLDMEMSFTSVKDIQYLVEKLMVSVFKNFGKELKTPFTRLKYEQAIDQYGSENPDLRFENKLLEVTSIFKQTTFNAFKGAKCIKMVHIEREISKKQIKKLEEIAKKNGAKGLAWASLINDKQDGPGFKFFESEMQKIQAAFNLKQGTYLFICDTYEVTCKALGAVRVELNSMFKLASDSDFAFVWIDQNWPLFEQDEETKKYTSAHHPFTSPTKETLETFDKDPKNAKAQAYDLALNGFEIGGGSMRINDLKIQERMFKTLGLTEQQIKGQFGFFLEAFKYGLPPHGGIAFGIDRIAMILSGSSSIREVIAFPKNAKGLSVMEDSPSVVDQSQLDEYMIQKIKPK